MATKFNMNDLNPGTWFDYPRDGGRVCLRPFNINALSKLRKETVKTKVEYKYKQRFTWEDPDNDRQNEETWDYCIVDWEDFLDGDDNPLPCNRENKVALMSLSVEFAQFVGDKLTELAEAEKQFKEDEEKN